MILLRRNVEDNELANVEILEVAVSDNNSEALIRVSENPATASLVWHRENPSAIEVAVKTVVVDDLVERGRLSLPRFVKIDVEGAEGQALLGMRGMLVKARPVIFLECSDTGRKTTWHLLSELGYDCQSAITREWVTDFEQYRHSDFLWIPRPAAALDH